MGIFGFARGFFVIAGCCALAPSAVADPDDGSGALLPVHVLSTLAGFPLPETEQVSDAPNTQIKEILPETCRTVYNSSSTLVYGDDYASYQNVIYADGVHRITEDESPHTAAQGVVVYPTAQAAAAAFDRLVGAVRSCATKIFMARESDGNTIWRLDRAQVQPDRVRWYSRQLGSQSWPCANDHRRKGRSIVSATICQIVDPGSPAEAQAVDARLDRITGLLLARTD